MDLETLHVRQDGPVLFADIVLACDLRFAARESAILSQPEQGFGLIPGAGGIQHLTRLLGRARALEVLLNADDYDAELAERYGWINRALPTAALGRRAYRLPKRANRTSTSLVVSRSIT